MGDVPIKNSEEEEQSIEATTLVVQYLIQEPFMKVLELQTGAS